MATFVLVAGAWQGGWCWARVAPLLRARGHDVLTPTLTGLGDRAHLVSPLIGLDTHVEDITAMLDNERCTDVMLVGHSYSGQVIASVASRRPSAIRRLVYLDAFLPDHGDAAIDLQPPEIAHHYRQSVAEDGLGWLIPPRSLKALGVDDADDQEWLRSRLVPHPFKTFTDGATVTDAARDVPAAYVECTDWMRVFAPCAARAAERGLPTREVRTGHEAMVTAPATLADVFAELVDVPAAE